MGVNTKKNNVIIAKSRMKDGRSSAVRLSATAVIMPAKEAIAAAISVP